MPLRGDSIQADLAARDLTVNALALDSAGRLYLHPQALGDLQGKILRPASSAAFASDPLRIFRLARFAACWPHWEVSAEAIRQMQATSPAALAALPAERVGRELLKALDSPQPGRFFRVLAQGNALTPWFQELVTADTIPAGPRPWHQNNVLGHSLRIMDCVAGDGMAAWMALCHDLGKILTDPAILPHHYGHEQRGIAVATGMARRLGLSARHRKAAVLACAEHMKAGMYANLRPGTRRDLLWRVHHSGLGPSFWRLADADSGKPVSKLAARDLAAILPVRLPQALCGLGKASGEHLRQLHCRALAEAAQTRKAAAEEAQSPNAAESPASAPS